MPNSALPTTPAAPVSPPSDQNRARSYGKRTDGTPKGLGFFGEIPRLDGPKGFSTELSTEVEFDGKKVLLPLIVPTLSREEINLLVSGKKPTPAIYEKAIQHAVERMKAGKTPFADTGEQVPLPQSEEHAMQESYTGARPR